MKQLFLSIFLLIAITSTAQYTTPGTGVVWNFDSLAVNSNGVVTSTAENTYQIHEDITISATDHLQIHEGPTVEIAENVTLTFFGDFTVNNITTTFTAIDQNNAYRGFRFEEGSVVDINLSNLEYGGGLKVITSDFHIHNCNISNNQDIITTGAVIELSHGIPTINNNTFENNTKPAISSAGNAAVSPSIYNNIIQSNNTSNSNRPQINLGPSDSFQVFISDNTIIGNPNFPMVGGIAISTLLGGSSNVRIENNEIRNNRYGIALLGNNQTVEIINNQIINNNIQNIPLQGGSGITFNALTGSSAVISSNTIEGNLWGITVQGTFAINMGYPEIEGIISGENSFYNNGNGGEIYALYNNTALDIQAPNNCWDNSMPNTLEIAENVIFHSNDDSSLGTVIFDPIWGCYGVSIDEESSPKIGLFPQPATDFIYISSSIPLETAKIYDISGKLVKKVKLAKKLNEQIDIQGLQPGIYSLLFNLRYSKMISVQ